MFFGGGYISNWTFLIIMKDKNAARKGEEKVKTVLYNRY